MGKTVRVSSRTTTSPYMSRRRRNMMASSTSSTTASSSTSVTTLANSTSGTAPEPSLTTCTPTTSFVLQSTTTISQDQLNVIRQQIVPELRGEIRHMYDHFHSQNTLAISYKARGSWTCWVPGWSPDPWPH